MSSKSPISRRCMFSNCRFESLLYSREKPAAELADHFGDVWPAREQSSSGKQSLDGRTTEERGPDSGAKCVGDDVRHTRITSWEICLQYFNRKTNDPAQNYCG
jgi:hypothetical protein